MKFDEVHSMVGGIPFISKSNAKYVYDLIVREKLTNILELGMAHGTATCYMAAALQEVGGGKITSVDLVESKDHFVPTPEDLLKKTGLSKFVEIIRENTGYNWFLHEEIERNTENNQCNEVYDLCIIDGPKNWTIDGAAFFFVDKLMKTNGWIIFDDYHWTYEWANKHREVTYGLEHNSLAEKERTTPHIKEVFELLVKPHPNYGRFLLLDDSDWAIAQKTASENKTYDIVYSTTTRSILARILIKIKRKLTGIG